MIETVDKETLDISKKRDIVNNDEVVKVPISREKIIKMLKILKGFQQTLQEAIRR